MNTLDYNEINRKLTDLYKEHLCKYTKTELENAFGTNDYSNPLLIHCWEDYTKDYVRIMYIGRETSSWYSDDFCEDVNGYYDISKLIDLVKVKFDFKFEKKYKFFSLLYKIEYALNHVQNELGKSPKIHNFLWTNVFKFGRHDARKGRPLKNVRDWERQHFNILRDEIRITQPDLVIFVTGKGKNHDQDFLNPVLGDIRIISIENQTDIVEINCDGIDIPMYRIPRPENYKHNKIIDTLTKHFKQHYNSD